MAREYNKNLHNPRWWKKDKRWVDLDALLKEVNGDLKQALRECASLLKEYKDAQKCGRV